MVEGKPPRKNGRYCITSVQGYARMYDSEYFLTFVRHLRAVWFKAGRPTFHACIVHVTIDSFWPRKRKTDGLAFGDVDAPVSIVLDALQEIGCIENDGQVVTCTLRKHHDPTNPRTVIHLYRS